MSAPRLAFIFKTTHNENVLRDGYWFAIDETGSERNAWFEDLTYVGPFDTEEDARACEGLFENTGFVTPLLPEHMTESLSAPPVGRGI